jgi:glutamine synthetase
MLQQHVIPSARAGQIDPDLQGQLRDCVSILSKAVHKLHAVEGLEERAEKARILRLEMMVKIRETVDAVEAVVPADLWTLATYKDLLFLDQTLP